MVNTYMCYIKSIGATRPILLFMLYTESVSKPMHVFQACQLLYVLGGFLLQEVKYRIGFLKSLHSLTWDGCLGSLEITNGNSVQAL